MDGHVSKELLMDALEKGKEACLKIIEIQKAALKEKYSMPEGDYVEEEQENNTENSFSNHDFTESKEENEKEFVEDEETLENSESESTEEEFDEDEFFKEESE
jgi:hypothetical protein